MIILLIIFGINFNALLRDLYPQIIEETIIRVTDTQNDDINKPLVFILLNAFVYINKLFSNSPSIFE